MGNKISMQSSTKKIEVNDDGEYILLPLGDDKFISSFYKMMDDVQKKIKSEQSKDTGGDNIIEEMEKVVSVSDFLFERTESVFGAGTCKKVFGECRPGVLMFWEFFNAILPFVEEYQKECASAMKKYSPGRTGSI